MLGTELGRENRATAFASVLQPLETRYSRIDAPSSVEIADAGLYAATVHQLLLLPALDAAAGASVPQKRRAQKAL